MVMDGFKDKIAFPVRDGQRGIMGAMRRILSPFAPPVTPTIWAEWWTVR
jgi:hypothetical protein